MRTSRRFIAAIAVLCSALLIPAQAPASLGPAWGGPDGGPVLGPVPGSSHQGAFRNWAGVPSDIAGESVYSNNEFIATDHVFDDHGPDTSGDGEGTNPLELYSMTHGANAGTTSAGEFKYADPLSKNNAADITEVRVAADDDWWYLLVKFNTLVDPERTAIGGHIGWAPPDDGPLNPFLIHGSMGSIGDDGGVYPRTAFEVVADANTNTYEARIPRTEYQTGRRRLWLGSGVWAPGQSGALSGYVDLAFNQSEPLDSYWHDVQQASVANGRGLAAEIDFDLLTCQDCPQFKRRNLGWITPVFRSSQDLGEGVEVQTLHNQHEQGLGYKFYRSQTQPYTLYVPPGRLDQPRPLVLLLHYLGGNHTSFARTSKQGIEQWADSIGAIVAMPFGRGEAGWYEGPAEKDVFEVWRDVANRFAIDSERVYLSGMSMGGFGTWRLGALYPDQFAKAIVWAGPIMPSTIWPAPAPAMWPRANPPMCERDDPACGYTLADLFPNLNNLPMMVVHGGLDELVPSTGAQQWMDQFDRVGASPYRFIFYPNRRHETAFPGTTVDHVQSWLAGRPTRVTNPTRVRYRIVRDLLDPANGLTYGGAYWVDGMALADGASEGGIIAEVESRGGRVFKEGPLVGSDATGPFTVEEERVTAAGRARNQVRIDLDGLAAARIDTARLGWTYDGSNVVHVRSDTPLTLTLDGEFAPDTQVQGAPAQIVAGDVVVQVPAGLSIIRIVGPVS